MSGFRYNKGKPRMSLLPFDALYELASLFTESMKKYPARNWERGLSYSETSDSLLRHLTEWMNKEDIDSESGFHHDVHVLWNAIVLVTMRLRGIGRDDRKSNPVSDDVTGHLVEWHVGDTIAIIPGPNDPVPLGGTSNDIPNVMGPDNDGAQLGSSRLTVVYPVTSDVK